MGLEAQRRAVKNYAREHSYDLVEIVQEAASGAVQEGAVFSHEHRPVLSEVLERGGRGEFDILLVASFDRLSRDYMTLLFLRRLLKTYGVEAVSASEKNGNGDPFGELVEQIIAAISDFERKRILERVRGGKAAKKKEGRHVHGRVAYGYRSQAGRLEPVAELVPIVRRIFLEAREGDSPGKIVRRLNRDAIGGPEQREWNRTTVRNILENPVYAGERYGVKRAHPAIVSRRVFNQAQAALEARARG
jgi:site-specific DNA recombinase